MPPPPRRWLAPLALAALGATVATALAPPLLIRWYGRPAEAALPLLSDCAGGPGPVNKTGPPGLRNKWIPAAFFALPREELLVTGLRPLDVSYGQTLPDVLRSADGGRSWSCVGASYAWGTTRAGSTSFTVLRPPAGGADVSGGVTVAAAACIAGGRELQFPSGVLPVRSTLRPTLSGAGGVYAAPVADVWCTADGVTWRAAAPLPRAVVGATHVRVFPARVNVSGSGSGTGGSGGSGGVDGNSSAARSGSCGGHDGPPPASFDVLLGGWRSDGGEELWVAEYPPAAAYDPADPLAYALPCGWRSLAPAEALLTRTSMLATWLEGAQLLLVGGGQVPVDSASSGKAARRRRRRRRAADANATTTPFARPLPEDAVDLAVGTSPDAFPLADLMLVDVLPALLAPWQQQAVAVAGVRRLTTRLPDSRVASRPRAYALSSLTTAAEAKVPYDGNEIAFFQNRQRVYSMLVYDERWGNEDGRPAVSPTQNFEFAIRSHVLSTWNFDRASELLAPVDLGLPGWAGGGPSGQRVTEGSFDFILGASESTGELLRGSREPCRLAANCVRGINYSTPCRLSPWDSQCLPCTRCTPGSSFPSKLCVERADAVCELCAPCADGKVIAQGCGMPGNPSAAFHVCEVDTATTVRPPPPRAFKPRKPLLGAAELVAVGAALAAEMACALLVVLVAAAAATATSAAAASRDGGGGSGVGGGVGVTAVAGDDAGGGLSNPPATAGAAVLPPAARAEDGSSSSSTSSSVTHIALQAWGATTTAAVLTVCIALVAATLRTDARTVEQLGIAVAALAALCTGPALLAAAMLLPKSRLWWRPRAGGGGGGGDDNELGRLPDALCAAVRHRPWEALALALVLPWRPQLLARLARPAAATCAGARASADAPVTPSDGRDAAARTASAGSTAVGGWAGGGTTQQRLPSREWGATEPAAASRSRRNAAAVRAPLATLTPRQRSALRALTAGVAAAGDLPLLAVSIAWVMLARDALPTGPLVEGGGGGGAASAASAISVTMNVLLPALSALLCLWHLTAALMAVVGPGSEASSQAASAKLFSSGASSAQWFEEAEGEGGVVGMAGVELVRGGFHLHEQSGHHAAQSSAAPARGGSGAGHRSASAPLEASGAVSEHGEARGGDGRGEPTHGSEGELQGTSRLLSRPAPTARSGSAGLAQPASPARLQRSSPAARSDEDSPSSTPSPDQRQQQQQQQRWELPDAAAPPDAVVTRNPLQQPPQAVELSVGVVVVELYRAHGGGVTTASPPPHGGAPGGGYSALQRIAELWVRAATPEARRLAAMFTFWSMHPALLPAVGDALALVPLPRPWLRLLHALEADAQVRCRGGGAGGAASSASCSSAGSGTDSGGESDQLPPSFASSGSGGASLLA